LQKGKRRALESVEDEGSKGSEAGKEIERDLGITLNLGVVVHAGATAWKPFGKITALN